jgi:hypothetical protein
LNSKTITVEIDLVKPEVETPMKTNEETPVLADLKTA